MIAVIRIRGEVGVKRDIEETLNRLRLKKKYSCIVIQSPKEEQIGMIKKVKDFVAFGEIDDVMYKKLVEKRGKKDSQGKLKPFFRLHPPRGGIKSKESFPKGVLGNHKEKINELLERML
ncbi:MAG: uL30 family ribosomal protein [Candidatus Pacearchaeota archaeon]|nr:uL30 family ribosomal protein [Candidatus Pacearchaeota archaeon]MDE1848630.1 uL30 family ribosomal protein [Nanoarchaeota archaeon]